MKNIYISAISNPHAFEYVFLPYVAEALRSYCESIPEIARNYFFKPSIFWPEEVEKIISGISNPEIFAVSCYVWNFRKQMRLAEAVKEKYPNSLIVAGGPHIPDQPQNFFQQHPYLDLLVHGEGEIPFSKILLENLRCTPDFTNIGGVTININGTVKTNPLREKLASPISYPSPYLKGFLDKPMGEILAAGKKPAVLWETNRGCPYSCSFCDWGSSTMSKVRVISMDRISEEIKWIGANKVNYLHMCDANLGIIPRDLEIINSLQETKKKTGSPLNVMVSYAKNANARVVEIGRVSEEGDLNFGVTLSLQSLDSGVLKAIGRSNIPKERYVDLLDKLNKQNISSYSEIILGLPMESKDTFKKGVGELISLGIKDTIRIYPLVVLPNAPLSHPSYRKTYGIRTKVRRLWAGGTLEKSIADGAETVELVVGSDSMSQEDWVWCNIYSSVIQALQSGGILRYITEFLSRNTEDFRYDNFFEDLANYFLIRDHTFFGKLLSKQRVTFENILSDENANYYGIFRDSFLSESFSTLPYLNLWLNISLDKEKFYKEIFHYIKDAFLELDRGQLQDLISWQGDVVIGFDFNSAQGVAYNYKYNWNDYFAHNTSLEGGAFTTVYRDSFAGPGGRSPLVWATVKEYFLAVTGGGSPYAKYFLHDIRAPKLQSDGKWLSY